MHLANLKRQRKIQAWHDRAIEAGTEWDAEIKQQLETAQVILLLISPRFIASDYCYDLEMRRAVQRHDQDTARVIPIILKPCDWEGTPFNKLQVLPKDAKPITKWDDQDEAFLNVVQGIRRVVKELQTKKPTGATSSTSDVLPSPPSSSTYNPQTFTGRETLVSDLLPKLQGQTRLLWITGISGIGKTALGECLANQAWESDKSFQWIYLEILEGQSPDFASVAADLLAKLGDRELDPQERNNPKQVAKRLLQKLQSRSYWIQLDSLERLLNPEQPTEFVDPYWATFLQCCLTESNVVSRLVLTAQAFPTALVEFSDRYSNTWAEQRLGGLLQVEQQLEFFAKRGVVVEPPNREILTRIAEIYEGHPLILKVIAEDILKEFAGDVSGYWQIYQPEFEQVARELQDTRLDETEYNEALDRKVRERIKRSLEQLPRDALDLLCRSAVFRRPVPKKFWLAMIGDRTPQQQRAAYRILGDRALIEKERTDIRQHNLIRSVAYDLLKADTPTWHQAERQAAYLWRTAYEPAPNAPNLETVRGYLEAFDHYCEVGDWEAAKKIAWTRLNTPTKDHLCWQLGTWGYFREQVLFHSKQLNIARKMNDTQEIGWALGNLGLAYKSLGQYERAIDLYQQVLTIVREISDRLGESAALSNLGLVHEDLGQCKRALDCHQQALTIAREIGDRRVEGTALGNLGNAYNSLGQYQRAIDLYQQALTIAREIGPRQGEGRALGNLGNAYNSLGQYQRALDCHQQDLTIAREIGARQGEGIALGNLGLAYNSLGQYERAINFYQQYLTIAREIGNRQGEGNALGNLGITYEKLGDYAQSVDYAKQHLEIAREIGDKRGEGAGLRELGVALFRQHPTTEALENLQAALSIFQKVKSQNDEAEALKNLAELHQALGEVEEARQYCQQALALATKLGIPLAAECQTLMQELENGG